MKKSNAHTPKRTIRQTTSCLLRIYVDLKEEGKNAGKSDVVLLSMHAETASCPFETVPCYRATSFSSSSATVHDSPQTDDRASSTFPTLDIVRPNRLLTCKQS